jgi:membrane-bound lytic murein transglycosylase D
MIAASGRLTVVALFFLFAATPLVAETLPRPKGLEPDIGFWRRIFTEVSTDQALVHDNRELGVVYEKIAMPAARSPAQQRRSADAIRGKYERILKNLATGRRDGLTSEESRVLELWPADVSNAELRAAAGRVRVQQGLSDRFHAGLVRSGQWRDHIRHSLKAAGVPEDLAALPHVESSFNPEARSYVGAAGLWQFTGETGRRFMQVDHVVDERRDPYESSEAAARLLKYNYSIIGSWPLAITAYNHGLAGMRKAVNRMGTSDIEVIVRRYDGPAFGFASRNFYVSFLAASDVEQDPEKYFGPVRRRTPREELVIELPDYMKVETLEEAFGVTRSTLQAYNPALLPPVWDGAKYVPRGFRLRLPGGVIDAQAAEVLAAIPVEQRFGEQRPDRTHRVGRGETLSGIAARYRTTVPKLMAANGLRDARRIRAGQTLRLPVPAGTSASRVMVAATMPEAEPESAPATALPTPASAEVVAEAVVAIVEQRPPATYVVRAGDSLTAIARRTGLSEKELMARNGITNRNLIRVGQKLEIRGDSPVPAATVAAVEPVAPAAVAQSVVEEQPAAVVATAPPTVTARAQPVADAKPGAVEQSAATAVATAWPAATAPAEPAAVAPVKPAAPAPRTPMRVASAAEPSWSQPTAPTILLAPFLAVQAPVSTEPAAPPAGLAAADTSQSTVSPADPSDYLVAEDGTVEVQATETLSHYAEWLEVSPQALRKVNNWSRRRQPVVGRRLKLVFNEVNRATFTERRIAHHRDLQEAFFARYRITDTTEHRLRSGESVWVLAQQKYKVPVWLLRQYNPDLKFDQVRPGTRVVFPRLQAVAAAAPATDSSLASA